MGTIAMSTTCELRIKQFSDQFPNYWVSFDNMNFYAKVRDQRQYNQNQLLHYIAGYAAMNPKGRVTKTLTRHGFIKCGEPDGERPVAG